MYIIERKNDVGDAMYVVRVDWSESRVTYTMDVGLAYGYKNVEDAKVVCADLNEVFPGRGDSEHAFKVGSVERVV